MEGRGQIKTSAIKPKFTWNISNFSKLTENKLYSNAFFAGDCKWCLLLFPKGNKVDHLSIYLCDADAPELPYGWSRNTQFSLALINHSNHYATVTKESHHIFKAEVPDSGFTSFIPLAYIKHPAKGYLLKDTLTVEAEVRVHSAVFYYSRDEAEKQAIELEKKALEPNQSLSMEKPVVDIGEKVEAPIVTDSNNWITPLTTDPLNQTKGVSEPITIPSVEQVKKPVIEGSKSVSNDPASEPVKSSAHVQTTCKGLIEELSSRESVSSSKDISVPSQASSPDILQQQKEALQGFFNMSLESIQQANCFDNIEGILHTLIQHTNNLQEKITFEEIISRLAEFKESIPHDKAVVETAQAQRASLVGKAADLDSKLGQRKEELSSLESEFSTLSEEEAKLEAQIQRLMSQKEEVVTQKKSVTLKLERANEETCKDMEEWRSLEGEMKKANGEWFGGKEKLASANVLWKLFREDLGFGKLNIS